MESHVCDIGLRARPLSWLNCTLILLVTHTLAPVTKHKKFHKSSEHMLPIMVVKYLVMRSSAGLDRSGILSMDMTFDGVTVIFGGFSEHVVGTLLPKSFCVHLCSSML